MAKTPPLHIQLVPRPPLRDQAYDVILSGKFAPGDHLVEVEIAALLGLSRSPVREAFRRLEQEGYLLVTRAGVTVQQISTKDTHAIYMVRQRLDRVGNSRCSSSPISSIPSPAQICVKSRHASRMYALP